MRSPPPPYLVFTACHRHICLLHPGLDMSLPAPKPPLIRRLVSQTPVPSPAMTPIGTFHLCRVLSQTVLSQFFCHNPASFQGLGQGSTPLAPISPLSAEASLMVPGLWLLSPLPGSWPLEVEVKWVLLTLGPSNVCCKGLFPHWKYHRF